MVLFRNFVRLVFVFLRHFLFTKIYRMNIHKTCRISVKAKLDKTNPKGIFIGEESYIGAGAYILSHDFTRSLHTKTTIGKRSFIGINSVILPGITIGDHVIVGSGSVVTKSIPSNCIAVGNPAKIIRENISTGKFGKLIS